MSTNRRVVVTSIDDITLETIDTPTPGPGEVLVRSTMVGICGSDMHAVHGRHPFVSLPMRPGHEVIGVVTGVGADVDPAWTGPGSSSNRTWPAAPAPSVSPAATTSATPSTCSAARPPAA